MGQSIKFFFSFIDKNSNSCGNVNLYSLMRSGVNLYSLMRSGQEKPSSMDVGYARPLLKREYVNLVNLTCLTTVKTIYPFNVVFTSRVEELLGHIIIKSLPHV